MTLPSRKIFTILATALVGALAFAAPGQAADFNWRMQSNLASGEPGYESVRTHFSEALEKMSGGRLKI